MRFKVGGGFQYQKGGGISILQTLHTNVDDQERFLGKKPVSAAIVFPQIMRGLQMDIDWNPNRLNARNNEQRTVFRHVIGV